MSMQLIGGADGPTSVFIAGKLGMGWINFFGFIIIVMMLVPNIIYFLGVERRKEKSKVKKKAPHEIYWWNIAEQIGRYTSILFMVCAWPKREYGFTSLTAFLLYVVGNTVLLLLYLIFWIVYVRKPAKFVLLMLSALPTGIFLLSGITLEHIPLIISALLFGIGHIQTTRKIEG